MGKRREAKTVCKIVARKDKWTIRGSNMETNKVRGMIVKIGSTMSLTNITNSREIE